MYLKACWVENAGPIDYLYFLFPFNSNGTPKPLILVGRNGSGKSIILSIFADALMLFAQTAYYDILKGRDGLRIPLFRLLGTVNQKINSEFAVALLKFDHSEGSFYYVEKTGEQEYFSYVKSLPEEFDNLRRMNPWKPSEDYRQITDAKNNFEKIFRSCSICFFPASRKETPHWLNTSSLGIESQLAPNDDISGYLRKPIFIESSGEENKRWLLDVFLDSLIDSEIPETGYDFECKDVQLIDGGTKIYSDKIEVKEKLLLKQSRKNIELVLKKILENENAILKLNSRNLPGYRLCISDGSRILVPSLDHLSSGQSILFNLFATIIRYSDKGDINKSMNLEEIRGIVVIDEIDAHLDTDLQHDVLPRLLRLFPQVQFILTTHSPIFLLGMEKQYGKDGFETLEMPNGTPISTERFSEFTKSFEFLKSTKAFEEELQTKVQRLLSLSTKPMILLEGKTDLMYIKTALTILGRNDILEQIDIDQVGLNAREGSENSGSSALEKIEKMYRKNSRLLKHKLLLLYDCDTNKKQINEGYLFVESIIKIETDCAFPKGIENLLPAYLLQSEYFLENKTRFYRTSKKDYGFRSTTIEEFDKDEFCKWVCEERKNAGDLKKFDIIIEIFERFLSNEVVL